jgi:hypothetical protein
MVGGGFVVCTRVDGHEGDHAAHGPDFRVLLRWPNAAARMDIATLAQARAVLADLAHALRTVAPQHPVLDAVAPFLGESANG